MYLKMYYRMWVVLIFQCSLTNAWSAHQRSRKVVSIVRTSDQIVGYNHPICLKMESIVRRSDQIADYTDHTSHRATPKRRAFLTGLPCLILSTAGWNMLASSSEGVTLSQPTEQVFKVGEAFGIEKSKARFQEARKTLKYLISNYDAISREGGDNVRRYLGIVGIQSSLYGIMKVLRELKDEANDIVEFTENMNDFEFWLRVADTAAYSAVFAEPSGSTMKPEKLLLDAKNAAKEMLRYMDAMASDLDF